MEELVPGDSLMTETPQEGRELALRIARATLLAIQEDLGGFAQERGGTESARPQDRLFAAAHLVAAEFATIAAANHYWRGPSWKRPYRADRGG